MKLEQTTPAGAASATARRRTLGGVAAMALVAATVPLAVSGPAAATTSADICGTPQEVTLWAGQTTDAGSVTVSNTEDTLYIQFDTTSPWLMTESHAHVADTLVGIPTTKKGNPKIGNFAYQTSYDPPADTDTYAIPKSALSLDLNEQVIVAAHAALISVDENGNVTGGETGWGDGERFVDRGSWATYITYAWQDCTVDPPVETSTETSFARDMAGNATCFLDLDLNQDDVYDFNRWGWTNGPLGQGSYEFELYAGAGRCNLNAATDVGKVLVDYTEDGTVTVTFMTEGTNPTTGVAYAMVDAHAYVGNAELATNNGSFTVAPGQYPQTSSELNGATSKTYTFTGVTGDIYVVAHSSVSGFPNPAPELG
jgi:hypothetical protein